MEQIEIARALREISNNMMSSEVTNFAELSAIYDKLKTIITVLSRDLDDLWMEQDKCK